MADVLCSLGAYTILSFPIFAKRYLPIIYPYYASDHFEYTTSSESALPSTAVRNILVVKRMTETVTVTATKTSVSTETTFVRAFKTSFTTITETAVSSTSRVATSYFNMRAGKETPHSTFSAWCYEVTGYCAVKPTPTSSVSGSNFPPAFVKENMAIAPDLRSNVVFWLYFLSIFFLLALILIQALRSNTFHPSVRQRQLVEETVEIEKKIERLQKRVAELEGTTKVQADEPQMAEIK